MNEHQAREQEQVNTEVVDALLNKNICDRCGGEIREVVMEDQNGMEGEVEIGHDPECQLVQL